MARLGAYVPCFNNAETIVEAARSLRAQVPAPDAIIVVDDGSSDGSPARAREGGFRVLEMGSNQGRGAVRARAVRELDCEFILGCDATMTLSPDFTAKMMPLFGDAKVAAVFGRVMDRREGGAVRRWRRRHLFKCDVRMERRENASLATWGAVLRRSAVLAVGNFDAKHRHTEDAELGERLLAAGWNVVFEPEAHVVPQRSNTLSEVLERYWRWNVGASEPFSGGTFLKRASYSAKVMARQDLKDGDLAGAMISLMTPCYFLWRRVKRARQ